MYITRLCVITSLRDQLPSLLAVSSFAPAVVSVFIMQFNILITLAVAAFGCVGVASAPVPATNAERLALGLPLKPPTMASEYSYPSSLAPTKVDPSAERVVEARTVSARSVPSARSLPSQVPK